MRKRMLGKPGIENGELGFGVWDETGSKRARHRSRSPMKVVNDPVQGRQALMDQIFKMQGQHLVMIEPAEIRRKTICDVWKFDIGVSPSQNADFKTCIEIGKRPVILVVNMAGFHIGHIKNVRDDYIARVTKDKIGNESRGANTFYNCLACKKMSGGNVAGAQRAQPSQRLFG